MNSADVGREDQFEFRLCSMKAKLEQIKSSIGSKRQSAQRSDSEEAQKYYEISCQRGNQELDVDQETIEENPVDIVNRKKMELRAWNVRDMPRQSLEGFDNSTQKILASAARAKNESAREDKKVAEEWRRSEEHSLETF